MTVWMILRVRARKEWSRASDALFDPLAAAALLSFVMGYILFIDPPTTSAALSRLGVGATSVMAAAFLVASMGAVAYFPNRTRTVAHSVP